MKKKRSRQKTDANFLPDHIGQAFQQELITLVNSLEGHGETDAFKCRYLQSEFLAKYCDATTTPPDVRAAAAISKWYASEAINQQTNIRLYADSVDFGYVTSELLFERARVIIRKVLGCVPPDLFEGGSHTNGASTRVGRSPKAALLKHVGKAHVTFPALKHWSKVSFGSLLEDQVVELRGSSVLFTVPKSSEIDRAACKEPEINLYLQRCVGGHIRSRLKRFGINLNDQTINQRLARDALSQGLATIDLSAASDSITHQLVMKLLPFEWYDIMDDLRVHFVEIEGHVHETEMFSSMGNGFTFELESLLFWALTRAIAWSSGVKGRISVYGDDIIAPSCLGRRIQQTFHWLGFRVNGKKSNWSGSFRESCGKHYYRGFDVTPFYIREPVRTKTDIIRLLNRLLEWDGRGWGFFLTEEIAKFHQKWSKVIPQHVHGGPSVEEISSLVTGDKPRQRILPRTRKLRLTESEETGRLLCWFTTKERLGEDPLTLDPRLEGRHICVAQPVWAVTAPWNPYLIYEEEPSAPIPLAG